MKLRSELENRILILDGAMGTMIQRHKLVEKDYRGERFAKLRNITKGQQRPARFNSRPDIIYGIHCKYLEAGADIIETNTFNAQRISMDDYGMCNYVREINLEGVLTGS